MRHLRNLIKTKSNKTQKQKKNIYNQNGDKYFLQFLVGLFNKFSLIYCLINLHYYSGIYFAFCEFIRRSVHDSVPTFIS